MDDDDSSVSPLLQGSIINIFEKDRLLVSEQQNPGQFNYSDRGLGNPQESEYTLFLQDGLPLMSEWIGFPTLYYQPFPQSVSEIQLIRGGSSLLYGPEPAPAVNFVSQRPAPGSPWQAYMEQVGGSNGFYSSYASVQEANGPFEMRLDAGYQASDGQRNNGEYHIWQADGYFGYRPDDKQLIALDVHVSRFNVAPTVRANLGLFVRDRSFFFLSGCTTVGGDFFRNMVRVSQQRMGENMSNTPLVNPYAPVQVQKKPDGTPEVVPAIVIAAFIVGLISLVVGIANFVNGTVRGEITKEKLKELQEKLDSLLKGQAEIVGLLQIIFQEIKWSEILIQMSDAVNNINYQYDAMLALAEGDNTGAMAWANAVLAENNGLTKDLFVINDVVMGQTIFNPALMQIFAQKVAASSSTQSQYYDAVTFFRDVLLIEGKGMCALANAYKYMNTQWDPKDFTAKWKAVLDTQASYSKQFLDPLAQFYSNPSGASYFVLTGNENHYVDTNENVAKEGESNVVVGLALYLKGNRLGLKVLHAAIDAQGLVDQSSSQWRDSPGWGSAFFDLNPNHYADTNVTVVPAGNITTGAQLYQKGNRVAIRLQSVPYDPKTGRADFSQKQWTDSPGMGNNNYYDLYAAGHYAFMNNSPLQPRPLSFVTAVALFQFGNQTALKQNTVYYVL